MAQGVVPFDEAVASTTRRPVSYTGVIECMWEMMRWGPLHWKCEERKGEHGNNIEGSTEEYIALESNL